MAGERDAEANRDGKVCELAGTPEERREIVRQGILCASHSCARDEIEKT